MFEVGFRLFWFVSNNFPHIKHGGWINIPTGHSGVAPEKGNGRQATYVLAACSFLFLLVNVVVCYFFVVPVVAFMFIVVIVIFQRSAMVWLWLWLWSWSRLWLWLL